MSRTPYLLILGGTAALLFAASAAFALAMDPYGLFRVDQADRPSLEREIAQIKLFQAVKRGARGVILGNSRADVGFDPGHALFTESGVLAHNLAAPGARIERSQQQLAALCRTGRVEVAVLGLDFIDFVRPAGRIRAQLGSSSMRTTPSTRQYARALLSAEALVDSSRALLARKVDRINRQTASGMNLLNAYAVEARQSGYAPFFEQRLAENAKRWAQHTWVLMDTTEPSPSALRTLLGIARMCQTRLLIVTYPYHVQYLALLREAGLWDTFEDWKRQITSLIAEAEAGATVVLIDVARPSPASREKIPERGDTRTIPDWYWEAGHFKASLGNVVLGSALGDKAAAEKVAAVRLSPKDIESVLESDRTALDLALSLDKGLSDSVKSAWRNQSQLVGERLP